VFNRHEDPIIPQCLRWFRCLETLFLFINSSVLEIAPLSRGQEGKGPGKYNNTCSTWILVALVYTTVQFVVIIDFYINDLLRWECLLGSFKSHQCLRAWSYCKVTFEDGSIARSPSFGPATFLNSWSSDDQNAQSPYHNLMIGSSKPNWSDRNAQPSPPSRSPTLICRPEPKLIQIYKFRGTHFNNLEKPCRSSVLRNM